MLSEMSKICRSGNKIRSARNKRNGFTMLEVLVAFTILTVGLLAVMPITVFMMQMNVHNKNTAVARMLAEQKVEEFKASDCEAPFLSDDGDTTDLHDIEDPDHSTTITRDGITYTAAWNIAQNVPERGVKTINVIISWADKTQPNNRRFIKTMYIKKWWTHGTAE